MNPLMVRNKLEKQVNKQIFYVSVKLLVVIKFVHVANKK